MQIKTVQTAADLRTFIDLPYRLYKDDPIWVPPLRSEARAQFEHKKNPFLDHCQYQLFLLEVNGKTIGRIAAFIDLLALDYWGEKIGLFGYFECPPDQQAATLLLNAARSWLQNKNMHVMRGPWSFVSQEWGMVVEGHTPSPCVMAPHNPPYYNDHLVQFGLEKIKDLLVYYIDTSEGDKIPERILKLTDRVANRCGVTVRQLEMKNFEAEVDRIVSLSTATIGDNWGYVPVTEAEVYAMARDLKPIINPKGVFFADDAAGKTIGFGVAIPDVNVILKGLNGHLLPFGWAKLMWQLPHLTQYRMFALGVIPKYQGKAVDSLIYRSINEALYTPSTRIEINYVLEDNAPMNNAIKKLEAKPLRRYRVYQMVV